MKKHPPLVIDISSHEIENKLDHWLSPKEKLRGKLEEIRAKHKAKYRASEAQKKIGK